eukprot:SAG31_NODE_22500_length_524_cov_0.967059_1_plen_159_part_10
MEPGTFFLLRSSPLGSLQARPVCSDVATRCTVCALHGARFPYHHASTHALRHPFCHLKSLAIHGIRAGTAGGTAAEWVVQKRFSDFERLDFAVQRTLFDFTEGCRLAARTSRAEAANADGNEQEVYALLRASQNHDAESRRLTQAAKGLSEQLRKEKAA